MAVKTVNKAAKPISDDPQGIAALGAGLSGLFGDIGRGLGNTASNIGDFLASRAPDTTRAGEDVFGKAPVSPPNRTPGYGAAQHQASGRAAQDAIYANRAKAAASQTAEPEMTFADYLAMANELGLGGTPDYSAMRQQLHSNASSADSRLDAMYRQLRGSIDADATGIGQSYDAAVAGQNQNAQQAQAVTNQGYDAARAAQTKQLEALGIGEAAGTLAANGGFAAGDQGAANANIEQNRLAATQQGTANKASALNYNTGIGNAAGLEGNVQRALVQQRLAESLAKIGMQEQQDAVSGNQSRFQTALQLKSMDDSAGSGQARAAQQDFENQLAVAKLKLDEAKANGSQKTLADALTNYAQLQQIAQQAGVGDDADSYKAFLENLGLASKF